MKIGPKTGWWITTGVGAIAGVTQAAQAYQQQGLKGWLGIVAGAGTVILGYLIPGAALTPTDTPAKNPVAPIDPALN